MRIAKAIVTAGLVAAALSLGGCYNDRPSHWGDRHHHQHRGDHHGDRHGHHGHHGHDRDHGGWR
jgi:hypothetical protein